MLNGLIQAERDRFWENGEARCREILYLCNGDVNAFVSSVSAWIRFSSEYVRRQQDFLKNRVYASTDFESLRLELYENSNEMRDFYLLALMFSYVFSVNYVGFLAFFEEEVLSRIKGAKTVCDVGCGPGLYLTQMLLGQSDAHGTGLDISEASLETTAKLLSYHNVQPERYQLLKGDIRNNLPLNNCSQDAVVCCELLEHLDDPHFAVAELRRILKPGGILCLSAAIRMESIDHIHLFSHHSEVKEMLVVRGFEVIKEDFP